jgi:hypothetical protein
MADEQAAMVHRLPKAPLVERIDHVLSRCAGRRVVHVGFADAGFREMQQRRGEWLHERLASAARELVGLDIDDEGVAAARAAGFEAHAVDCCDATAVASLGIAPAEVVLAGEIIEHLDAPGAFLEAMRPLVAPGGTLLLTTPNASGFLNSAAALARREVNHPDHVLLFSYRTLTNLLDRHGWEVDEVACYVPQVKAVPGATLRDRVVGWGGRAAVGLERLAAKAGASFFADGLIVEAHPR